MPTYEFECRECGAEFSVFVPYSKKKDTRCPECGGDDLREHYGLAIGGAGGSGGGQTKSTPRFT